MEIFERLGPFMRRARTVEVGRDRLYQLKQKLQFLLVTEEISTNSLQQLLRDFPCPVYRALDMAAVEKYFGFHGTKVLGFHRQPLSCQVQAALKGCNVVALQPLPEHPRVAVLGASGIGRHHMKWWMLEGAEVVAFLGSSADSVATTAEMLKGHCGFAGKGYTDLAELLTEAKPDIVDVCLPPRMHYEACKAALKAGCHVLCEKPFVFDDELGGETLRAHGLELERLAGRHGLRLGVCTQYVMAAKEIAALWRAAHPHEELTEYSGNLVSPTRNRPPVADWTWVDLAPHLLGVAQVLSGGGILEKETLKRNFVDHLAEASFVCRRADGTALNCHIRTFHTDVPPSNVRQISLNGALYDIGGRNDADGVFQMTITGPEGTVERLDMLRLLIRSFLQGKIEVTPSMANQNMDWLLFIMNWHDKLDNNE